MVERVWEEADIEFVKDVGVGIEGFDISGCDCGWDWD
jgi:hypothetical protein